MTRPPHITAGGLGTVHLHLELHVTEGMELPDHALTIESRWSCRDSTRNYDQEDTKGEMEEDETGAIRKNQQGPWSKSFPMDGGWLKAEGPPDFKPNHRRCIAHFDIDCFYAQVCN